MNDCAFCWQNFKNSKVEIKGDFNVDDMLCNTAKSCVG